MNALSSPTHLDLPDARARFSLDRDIVFLNHGSFGACPLEVQARQTELRARMERQPARFFNQEAEALLDSARHALAAFVGANAEGLAFVTNATMGVNTVLRSLSLAPGDELLTTDHEYAACKNALDFAAERAGAAVVVARVPFPLTGPEQVKDAVLGAVTSRTRLALLDHVTSPSALVFPIADLVRELRARGVETLVDGAHAVGMLPLDLEALGAAYYTSNCHKWLCAPKGSAFLYVREDLRDAVVPLAISHGRSTVRPERSRFRLLFDWTGTYDPSPHMALPEAITALGGMVPGGAQALGRRNRDLAIWGRSVVCRGIGASEAAPDGMLGAMATIPLPRAAASKRRTLFDRDPLQVALMDRFRVEIPVFPWPTAADRVIRLSAQAYNRTSDYETLAEGLRTLLREEGAA